MRTLDEVIRCVEKAASLPDADLDKDILHYLMMYRYLLRQQAELEEKKRPFVVIDGPIRKKES